MTPQREGTLFFHCLIMPGLHGHLLGPHLLTPGFVKRWVPIAAVWGATGLIAATYVFVSSRVF